MTEGEWLACADPRPMLQFLESVDKASERKLRLFAVACCRHLFGTVRVPPLYEHEVDVAERYADGAASAAELWEARRYSNSTAEHACMNTTESSNTVESYIGVVMAESAAYNAAWAATQPGNFMPDDGGLSEARLAAELAILCDLLRDLFAPFADVAITPSWLTPLVVSLATAAYGGRQLLGGTVDLRNALAVLSGCVPG